MPLRKIFMNVCCAAQEENDFNRDKSVIKTNVEHSEDLVCLA